MLSRLSWPNLTNHERQGTSPRSTRYNCIAWAAGTYHLIPLDPEVYSVPYVPFQTSAMDGLWIATAAMAISAAATLIPARAASRILPVDILRYE